MEKSNEKQRKQITEKSGHLEEVGMEIQGNQGSQSKNLVKTKGERRNDVAEDTANLLEKVLRKENMKIALKRVKKNKGSHGVDGMKTDELREHLIYNWATIKEKLLAGTYVPSPVRRKGIPKADGGTRYLGIPTVQDRLVQQAIAQEMNKIYDPTFSKSSYGFRPNKSAHQAIKQAEKYVNEGYIWVVDMDLEKFFDKVNHDILMGRLSRKIKDKRLLKLIRKYLEAGIMAEGIQVRTEEGTPQGGPLSPLLANILLDEVDKELEERGHKFCRYADDCNIYVKSEKAGKRVMASIKKIIEGQLRLKINEKKSAVDLVVRRKFLGFSFHKSKGVYNIKIHKKAYKRFKEKLKELTNRNTGISMEQRLLKLKQYIIGWVNYYGIAKGKTQLFLIDGWVRRRLRACIWKQWKRVRTRYARLIKLGIPKNKALEHANTRKSYWRISNSPILGTTITNQYLKNLGYTSILERYQLIHNS